MFSFTCAQRNKICFQFFPCCFFKCLFGDLNDVGATDGDGEGVLLFRKSDVSITVILLFSPIIQCTLQECTTHHSHHWALPSRPCFVWLSLSLIRAHELQYPITVMPHVSKISPSLSYNHNGRNKFYHLVQQYSRGSEVFHLTSKNGSPAVVQVQYIYSISIWCIHTYLSTDYSLFHTLVICHWPH